MSSFKRPPPRPAKQIEGRIGARRSAPSVGLEAALGEDYQDAVMSRALQTKQRDPEVTRGNRIKASARGEQCTVRLVGVCTFDPATTIWSHARWGAQLGEAGRGMSTKAIDLCGAYACSACDGAYDGQISVPHLTRDQIDLDWSLGHFRSMGILARKGLL